MRGAGLALIFALLAACSWTAASTITWSTSTPPEALAHACETHQDFVTFARHDIANATRTEAEIVDQLREYQDSLEADAQTLSEAPTLQASVLDQARATQALADAIGHLRNAIGAVGYDPVTVSAGRRAAKAARTFSAYCRG